MSKTGDPIVSANNTVLDLLAAPLAPGWTIEGLAEQVLSAVASVSPGEAVDLTFRHDANADPQIQRLIRPLLACLAAKSATETGQFTNLYTGQIALRRQGSTGPVWILGHFENQQGRVRLSLRRSISAPEWSEPGPAQLKPANDAVAMGQSQSNSVHGTRPA